MKEENDFFKRCFDIVAGLEVKNESQAIAKEVVLDEIENLQSQLKAKEEVIKEVRENLKLLHYQFPDYDDMHKRIEELEEILSKGENK